MRQFEHARLVDDVRQAIEGAGVPPSSVMLEVTESVLAKEPDVTIARLEQLSALGIRLAIDDFGTGYSSLSRLRRFPLDIPRDPLAVAAPDLEEPGGKLDLSLSRMYHPPRGKSNGGRGGDAIYSGLDWS